MLKRWMPFAVATAFAAVILIRAGTAPGDLLRYAAYAALAVVVPGTLVYRALRRAPHTLVEDLAMGAAVGLALEVGAWAAFSALDLRSWLWAWPIAVVAPFAAVPRLRRHWWVRDYAATPTLAWSWAVAGVVGFFTAYLAMVFLDRNPILPTSEATRQYIDLSYQLSLAGEAKHNFPVDLPQVAGEPLYYHWFSHAHMAATSLIGGIDLPVVALRLAIPGLSALAILLTAVVGWRISGRSLVGAVAAALFFVVGEFNFTDPVTLPFGTQVTFVVWHGISMIYSWVLLLALIACLSAIVTDQGERRAPPMGRGAIALATLLLFASSGAKASTLPVVGIALAVTAAARLISERRIPWRVVVMGLIVGAAQLFAMAVLFRFQTYGVQLGPLQGLRPYWSIDPASGWPQWMVAVGVWIAFTLNLLLRLAGIGALVWVQRFRLEPVQWFLLGGALGGPALYLLFSQPGSGNQYFTRAGFAFGVILSAWGYALVLDRARLSQRAQLWLGCGRPTVRRCSGVDTAGQSGPAVRGQSARAASDLGGRAGVERPGCEPVLVGGEEPVAGIARARSGRGADGGACRRRAWSDHGRGQVDQGTERRGLCEHRVAAVPCGRRPVGARPQRTRRHRGDQRSLHRFLR